MLLVGQTDHTRLCPGPAISRGPITPRRRRGAIEQVESKNKSLLKVSKPLSTPQLYSSAVTISVPAGTDLGRNACVERSRVIDRF